METLTNLFSGFRPVATRPDVTPERVTLTPTVKGVLSASVGECTLCNGDGWLSDGVCDCHALRVRSMRISSACLPNRAGQVYSVEKLAQALNLSISRAQATLAELCQRPALLHLHGPNWIGKTSLAHHLALEWCRVSGVVYRVCPDLMTDLRASIGFGGNPSQTLREMRVDPRALIFDEVGEGRSTDFTLSLYEGVIGRRLEAGLATVLITNLSGRGELRAAVGDRCFSRLGNAQIVEMG